MYSSMRMQLINISELAKLLNNNYLKYIVDNVFPFKFIMYDDYIAKKQAFGIYQDCNVIVICLHRFSNYRSNRRITMKEVPIKNILSVPLSISKRSYGCWSIGMPKLPTINIDHLLSNRDLPPYCCMHWRVRNFWESKKSGSCYGHSSLCRWCEPMEVMPNWMKVSNQFCLSSFMYFSKYLFLGS